MYTKRIILVGALLLLGLAQGQQFEQPEMIQPEDIAAYDNFGSALALDGDTLAVGAPGVDLGQARNAGAVYIYRGKGHDWSESARLTPGSAQPESGYGTALALDGKTLAVGARFEYNPESGNGSGAVYVYTQTGNDWGLQARLAAPDGQPFDLFGYSLVLHGDTLAVSAPAADSPDGRRNSGAVYLYRRSGSDWYLQARLQPADAGPVDQFGWSLALDDNELFASAPGHDAPDAPNSGIVYVFRPQGQDWVEQDRLLAESQRAHARFGSSLSLGGSLLVVIADQEYHGENTPLRAYLYSIDAGAAYVFRRQGDQWRWQARLAPDSPDSETETVRLGFSALDSRAKGGARIALTGTWQRNIYRYQQKGDGWQMLEPISMQNIPLVLGGDATVFSGSTLLINSRFFARLGPPQASGEYLDAAGAVILKDW